MEIVVYWIIKILGGYQMRLLRALYDMMPIIVIPVGVGDTVRYVRLFDDQVYVEDLKKGKK